MKKALIAVCITCALSLAAYAGDEDKKAEAAKKQPPTAEQKAIRKEMIEKYDTNKDGKLDKEERAKMSDADKAKLKEASGAKSGEKKKAEKSN
jgi:hypothetical protein